MAATLEAVSSKPPILHAGECTPAIVREFELAFANYCTIKDIAEEKQTKTLIGCFRDHRVTDVLADPEECKTLLGGTVPEFMKQICSIVLQPGWEDDHRITMTARRHLQSESFFTFANTVRSMNSLLVNTKSHLSDERLRSHLESTMCRDLLDDYRADPLAKVIATNKLSLWLHEVKRIDDARLRGYNRMKAAVEEVERKLNKRLAPAGDSGGSTKRPRLDGPSNSSAGNNVTKCCPTLTEEERKLLDANQGCRRCRLPFQTTHRSSDKTCPFPSADPYVPVTQKFIDNFCKGKGKENTPAAAAAAVVDTHVAAVLPDIDDPNDSSGTSDGDLSMRNF